MTIHVDGSGPRILARPDGGAWSPAWAPDASSIAYLEHDPTGRGRYPVGGSRGENLNTRDAPLLDVKVIDVATRTITSVPARVVTDGNGVAWLSDSVLLVNRWD